MKVAPTKINSRCIMDLKGKATGSWGIIEEKTFLTYEGKGFLSRKTERVSRERRIN